MPIPTAYIRTPLTDVTGMLYTYQDFGRCADIEMKYINCLEAYGADRALKECTDILNDFAECFRMDRQSKRVELMREERFRQYSSGERSKNELYGDGPKIDSFQ